jgi:hypothetical protein
MKYALAFTAAFMLSFSLNEIAEAFEEPVGVMIKVPDVPAAALTVWLTVSTL